MTALPPGFVERFAIRLPDGTIARYGCHEILFLDRATAERQLDHCREAAAHLGVHGWPGEVVRQLCTPFVGDRDTGEHLVADLQRWLDTHTGGGAA